MQRDCVHSDEKRASLISGRRTVASNGAAFFGALGELSATRTERRKVFRRLLPISPGHGKVIAVNPRLPQ